jgi:hypothetical protein
MKTKRVNRYYCDFCKKSGCSAPHLKRHEERCTMNPNRHCGVCDMMEDDVAAPLTELVAMWPNAANYKTKDEFGEVIDYRLADDAGAVLEAVREASGRCPACILASIRQAGIPVLMVEKFDFRAEMDGVWAEVNEVNAENCQHG